jgi:hypothetical protein
VPAPFVEGTVPDGRALIYIYRPADNWGPQFWASAAPLVFAKNELAAIMSIDSYCSYVTNPGTIKFFLVSASTTSLTMEDVAGQMYYVKAGFELKVLVGTDVTLKLMPHEVGKTEIAGCKQVTE